MLKANNSYISNPCFPAAYTSDQTCAYQVAPQSSGNANITHLSNGRSSFEWHFQMLAWDPFLESTGFNLPFRLKEETFCSIIIQGIKDWGQLVAKSDP